MKLLLQLLGLVMVFICGSMALQRYTHPEKFEDKERWRRSQAEEALTRELAEKIIPKFELRAGTFEQALEQLRTCAFSADGTSAP